MTEYSNENRGVISKNERKTQDTHADIKGEINIEGRDYWLDGWRKERKDGSGSFYSLKAKPKDAPRQQAPQPRQQAAPPVDLDDDIPFAPETRA